MKTKLILLIGLILTLLTGCAKQPQKIGNTTHAQVTISNTTKKKVLDYLSMRMIQKEFYIVNQTDYSIDFRASITTQYKAQNSFKFALLQSLDGSEINEKGVDFFISEYSEKLTIQAKPYFFKTYQYNRHRPKKEYLTNNNDAFNSMQRLLNEAKNILKSNK